MLKSKTPIKLTLLLLLVCVLFFGSCGMEDPAITISGTVTDSMSGLPIDSAIIHDSDTISSAAFYSDSLGKYTLGGMGYRNFRVFCRKTGYQTKVRTVRSSKDHLTFRGVDFRLVPQQDSAR